MTLKEKKEIRQLSIKKYKDGSGFDVYLYKSEKP